MWGWEPRRTIVDGVTVVEPEFDAEQVAYLMAYQQLEADKGPHGHPMSEATDPTNQFKYRADEVPTVDHAAKALAVAQEKYYTAYPDAPRHGHLWTVRKID